MESTPDLSRIVNLIMQNPELIEQISALANSEPKETPESEEASAEVIAEETISQPAPKRDMRSHRHELLSAMKPYLSEGRRSALDSMSSILDIIDVMSHK
jgi:hypothetical protein